MRQNATAKKEPEYRPKKWMKAFISVLSEQGNISRAVEAAKVHRSVVYRAKETDTRFAAAWDEALEHAADMMEAEAWRRAVSGVDKPVGFYQGKAGEYVKEYSDNLLMFLLKGARPAKYRERHEITGKDGEDLFKNIKVEIIDGQDSSNKQGV